MSEFAARSETGGKVQPASLRAIATAASGAGMLFVLAAPALWNGFPLIFPDTGGYITRPLEGTLDLGRSALYGLFLDAGMHLSFWPNVIAQSAVAAWLVTLTLRTHGLSGASWLPLAVIAALSAGTSLPWNTGLLLPDIFFPAAILALHLLIFRSGAITKWERALLVGVILFAIPSHMAAAALCVVLIGIVWLLSGSASLIPPNVRLKTAMGAVVAGIALCPVSNFAITGNFAFTPGGSSFLFGRILESGIVARYLHEQCPDPALQLCAYRDKLPDNADDWLWAPTSPFHQLGGWKALGPEQADIIRETLWRYPRMHVETAAQETFDQLLSFQTEVSLSDNAPTLEAINNHAPSVYPALMGARQQTGTVDTVTLNLVHVPIAAAAMLGLVVAVLFRRRLSIAPEANALCLVVLLALLANATICATFSHSVDRYQSRLVWLAPFALGIALATRHKSSAPA